MYTDWKSSLFLTDLLYDFLEKTVKIDISILTMQQMMEQSCCGTSNKHELFALWAIKVRGYFEDKQIF